MKKRRLTALLAAPAVILLAIYAAWYAAIVIRTIEVAPDGSLAPNFSHYLCIYEAWDTRASGGFSLFLLSDPPEGTRSLFQIPSWLISMCGVTLILVSALIVAKIQNQKNEN
jgi:hypothetical protein